MLEEYSKDMVQQRRPVLAFTIVFDIVVHLFCLAVDQMCAKLSKI